MGMCTYLSANLSTESEITDLKPTPKMDKCGTNPASNLIGRHPCEFVPFELLALQFEMIGPI